jgi:hypothetical protein
MDLSSSAKCLIVEDVKDFRRQGIDNVYGVQPTLHTENQSFLTKLIKDVTLCESSAIVDTVINIAMRPDVVITFGLEPNTKAIQCTTNIAQQCP